VSDMSKIICGDCLKEMEKLSGNSVDSVVTDSPYGLAFMGKSWDEFTPEEYQKFSEQWGELAFRVLKSGGYLLAFSGTRTYHRMVVGLEDAGFEIKDQIDWIYGSGFPKSKDISKAIDKKFLREKLTEKLGHKPTRDQFKQAWEYEREKIGEKPYTSQDITGNSYNRDRAKKRERKKVDITVPITSEAERWDGWGTALKPAHEPIVLAQKPREGTYAENALKWGVGGLNIDGCRIKARNRPKREVHDFREDVEYDGSSLEGRVDGSLKSSKAVGKTNKGRWPANVVLDPLVGAMLDEQSGILKSGARTGQPRQNKRFGVEKGDISGGYCEASEGGASRFFYCAKAHKSERNAGLEDLEEKTVQKYRSIRKNRRDGYDEASKAKNDIATLKPINLMRYLVRLVTPPDGTVLDPFAGSGTTGCACEIEGFDYILIEKRERFARLIAPRRVEYWSKEENWSNLKEHKELEDPKKKKIANLEAFY